MKRFLFLLLCTVLLLCGCTSEVQTPTEKKDENIVTDEMFTDVDGEYVPVHNNVDLSSLVPSYFYEDESGRMLYKDESVNILTGIDVSNHQNDINWAAVSDDGIDYVMLRIGYRGWGSKGIMGIDERLEANYEGAKNAGLAVGGYFYSQATTPEEAREEALFLLDAVKDMEFDFPIAYDWEYVDNEENARTNGMTGEEITKCAKAFCEEIEKAGRSVMIYFNCEIGYYEYDLEILKGYDFWLAEYNSYPTFLYKYTMWQYTKTGRVNGIEGDVDLNISVVDYSDA